MTDIQYALVASGEVVLSPGGHQITTLSPTADPRGEWLPIENEDSEPFEAAKHWRLAPEPLRVDGDRVVRRYPVVSKTLEHA